MHYLLHKTLVSTFELCLQFENEIKQFNLIEFDQFQWIMKFEIHALKPQHMSTNHVKHPNMVFRLYFYSISETKLYNFFQPNILLQVLHTAFRL